MMSSRAPTNAFNRYRKHLTILEQHLPILHLLERVGTHQGWWTGRRTWSRTYARFNPDGKPMAIVTYETGTPRQEIYTVEIYTHRESSWAREQYSLDTIPNMWACINTFPLDPKLPHLPSLCESHEGYPTVYRYRPGKRCTIRFDQALSGTSRFAKYFRNSQGERLFLVSQQLWNLAVRGVLEVAVAEPLKWDSKTRTLWQGTVPGQPIIQQLKGKGGLVLAERLGKSLASIPLSGLEPHAVFAGQEQMDRSRRYAEDFSRRIPDLAYELDSLLDWLSTIHSSASGGPLHPIHGAPHAHQWLDDGGHLGLVDFDRFSMGDRELDVATFLTELEFEGLPQLQINALHHAFIAAYESVAAPLSLKLLAAYRAHKCLAKAYKASQLVSSIGDQKAKKHLETALESR